MAGPGEPRVDLADLLDRLVSDSAGAVTAVRRFPARPARTVPIPDTIDPHLADALRARGIEALYTHQARALELLAKGGHCVVVTPTASGKTLCYNLPVLQALMTEPATRALYLFPTKALAQDQLAELEQLAHALPALRIHTYDGDTPQDARRAVRARANVVLTNPDMLHSGILPHHTKWIGLFQNLRYVIIDELHTYRGVFGSHLANVLRRLQRICQHYGAAPQFVCTSATIANPQELAERLIGSPVGLVVDNGERFPVLFMRKRDVLVKLVNANLNLAWFSANFPRARQVFILRHPCGQFESWKRLGWEPDPQRLARAGAA